MEDHQILSKKSPFRYIALALYVIALGVDIYEFVNELSGGTTFLYVNLALFIFDIVFGIFLIYGLIRRNLTILNLLLIIFKVYDGTYYVVQSLSSIDAGHINTLDQVSSYLCVAAGVLSFITLFFFSLHYYFEKKRFWFWVENTMFLTGIILLAAVIISICNITINQVRNSLFGEVLFMCIQTFAIYFVCLYVQDYE